MESSLSKDSLFLASFLRGLVKEWEGARKLLEKE